MYRETSLFITLNCRREFIYRQSVATTPQGKKTTFGSPMPVIARLELWNYVEVVSRDLDHHRGLLAHAVVSLTHSTNTHAKSAVKKHGGPRQFVIFDNHYGIPTVKMQGVHDIPEGNHAWPPMTPRRVGSVQ